VTRRDAVKEAFVHAWTGYRAFAWGHDELRPVSETYTDWGQEAGGFGLSLVESLGTLWLMGLRDEFLEGVRWVERRLDFDVDRGVSHFEATIRLLGGLLSAYELSNEQHPVLLTKARDLADRLLYAYNTTLGIPFQTINLFTREAQNPEWMGTRAALAEFASVQLEFKALSYHTTDPQYRRRVERAMDVVERALPTLPIPGLWPVWADMETGEFLEDHLTLGARGDSFYEVLLKQWLLTNKTEPRYQRLFHKTATAIQNHLVYESSPSSLMYIAQMEYGTTVHTMDHLVCFSSGMFALAAAEWPPPIPKAWMAIAKGLGRTCHAIYAMTATRLGPEIVDFEEGAYPTPHSVKYILRPEAAEAWFYLWRVTKDPVWREYGWRMLQALNRHCRVPGGGFAGVRNVSEVPPRRDDLMQSFFLSETLKYLYLLFDDSSNLPLDEWVLTTEAHPLRRRNTLYREDPFP